MKIFLSNFLLFFTISLFGQIHHIGTVNCNSFSNKFDQSIILANSPDGRFVYGIGNLDASISIYQRDIESGQLTCVEELISHSNFLFDLDKINDVVISPDGHHMYLCGPFDAEIIVLKRNVLTGSIDRNNVYTLKSKTELSGINCLTFSPDGNYLYATGYHDGAIVVYHRNSKNGKLRFLEKVNNTQNKRVLLSGISSIKTSPDGQYLYTIAFEDAAINVFHRNEKTKKMEFVESIVNGQNGIEGLKGAKDIDISPDGQNVYVTGYSDASILIFERSEENGRLTFLEAIQKERNEEAKGLLGAEQLLINPDGSELYVTSIKDNSLSVYQRDLLTGQLEFDKMYQQKIEDTNSHLDMSMSPNGKNIYVSGLKNNEIDLFDRTYFINEQEQICQKDLINGIESTDLKSGIYFDTLHMANSTHIIQTHLNIIPSTADQFIELCKGESFFVGNKEFTASGIYTAFVTSEIGCDVELTLYLSYE